MFEVLPQAAAPSPGVFQPKCLRNMTRSLLWILVFFVPVSFAHGQASVGGVVTNEIGEPLTGATVQIYKAGAEVVHYAAVTGGDGRFAATLPSGRYRLEVRFLGYATWRQALELLEVGCRLNIVLRPATLYGSEVVAEASRARALLTPLTHSNITARELQLLPGMKDMPVHLARSVSVTHYTENGNDLGYAYLRLRGFGQRRVAVAINGIPQNDPEEHNVFWINFYDLQGSIRDVQVQRGAGSAFYGSTGIGGAINIVTDPYEPATGAMIEAGYGTYATQRYTLEGRTGLLGGRYVGFLRASRLLTDGYRDWSWSRFWRYFAGIRRYGDRHILTLQSYGGPQHDGLAYSGVPKAANTMTVTDEFGTVLDRRYNFSEFTEDIERFHQPHVEFLHDWEISPDLSLHQALFWIKGIGEFDFGGTFRSADYLRLPQGWRELNADARQRPLYISAPETSVLFRAALDQWQAGWMPRLTRSHVLGQTTVGAEARLHRSLRWGRVEEATGLPSEVVGADQDYRVYSFRGEKVVTALYGSHLSRPLSRLAIQADVQLTWRHYRIFEEQFFGNSFQVPYLFVNPRLGITINPERQLSAYLSVSLANREPRMKSLYDGEEAGAGFTPQFVRTSGGGFDYDQPIVKPERLVDVELGSQLERRGGRVRANVYWMDFRDEIVPSGGLDQFGVPRTGNADRTRHVGLELETSARLSPGLDAFANVTFSRSRFVEFVEYVTLSDFSVKALSRAGNPIAGFPARSGSVGLTYVRNNVTLRADAKFAGTQYVDNGGGQDAYGVARDDLKVDPYGLVSAGVRWEMPEQTTLHGLEITLDVSNVLNDKVLLFGNTGFGTPQFFPAATRHFFFGARYRIG